METMNDNEHKAFMDGTPARLKSYTDKWLAEPEVQAAIHRTPSPKAVADFTRVCEQTGLIDKLRKE